LEVTFAAEYVPEGPGTDEALQPRAAGWTSDVLDNELFSALAALLVA
jgi:hypothetical protein